MAGDGNEDVSDADAVLHPLSRYIEQVRGLEIAKQDLNATQEVIVGLIGGVGTDGSAHYAEDLGNPEYMADFGIGPGCQSGGGAQTAVPPVRMKEFTEAFTLDNMHSVCEDDYTDALETIAEKIREQIVPACYTECVKDTDPTTEVLDPECAVEQIVPGEDGVPLDECARDGSGNYEFENGDYVQPDDTTNVCYALLLDPDGGATGDPIDNMTEHEGEIYCDVQSFNLEVRIARREGFPAAGGTSITAACLLSDFPQLDCPGI